MGGLGWLLARICRIAILTSTAPSAILIASEASDGTVAGLGGLLPVAATVMATTATSEISHPNPNAAIHSWAYRLMIVMAGCYG